jgi:hypothetical protein
MLFSDKQGQKQIDYKHSSFVAIWTSLPKIEFSTDDIIFIVH